jgi:hypothetical protein
LAANSPQLLQAGYCAAQSFITPNDAIQADVHRVGVNCADDGH